MASDVPMIESGSSLQIAKFMWQGGGGLLSRGVDVPMTDSVSIEGRISVNNSDEMRRKLRLLLRTKPAQITVNFSRATYMDTSAIATLVEAVRIARGQGTRLVLAGLKGQPRRLLEIIDFGRMFEVAVQEVEA
jgi:anti-sigma B factor antagonist